MKLIVGLGNPDKKYQNTRHNLGFMILEKIAKDRGLSFNFDANFEAKIAESNDAKFVLPQTYMNNSGRAVSKIKNYFKIDLENIWVIHDDVDLEPGIARVVLGGSSAGHKGVQSIIDNINEGFWRIRIGIGKNERISTEDWVLEDFNNEENQRFQPVIDKVSNLVLESLSNNLKEETLKIVSGSPPSLKLRRTPKP